MLKKQLDVAKEKFSQIIKLKGTPHTIALGAAVGFFWNFIPSLGIGPFLSMGLAKIMKASAVAALTANLATGFFIPVFYSMNMITGRLIRGDRVQTSEIGENIQDSLQETFDKMEEIVETPVSFFSLDKIQNLTSDFLIGAIINAILGAVIFYIIFWFVLNKKFNSKRKKKLAKTEK